MDYFFDRFVNWDAVAPFIKGYLESIVLNFKLKHWENEYSNRSFHQPKVTTKLHSYFSFLPVT